MIIPVRSTVPPSMLWAARPTPGNEDLTFLLDDDEHTEQVTPRRRGRRPGDAHT